MLVCLHKYVKSPRGGNLLVMRTKLFLQSIAGGREIFIYVYMYQTENKSKKKGGGEWERGVWNLCKGKLICQNSNYPPC
jgi:hypothetical protein